MLYYASKKYKIVCDETCYHRKNIKPENLLTYKTLRDAISDGCRLCKHCAGKNLTCGSCVHFIGCGDCWVYWKHYPSKSHL